MLLPSLLCTFYLTIQFYCILQYFISHVCFLLSDILLLSVTYFFVIQSRTFLLSIHARNVDIMCFDALNIIKY